MDRSNAFLSRKSIVLLSRYLAIGGFVTVVDVACFQILLRAHSPLIVATSVAYFLGVVSHFTLNKFLNFKDASRSTFSQAQTYAAIVAFAWLVTLGIVVGVTHAGFPPLLGKMIGIIVNVPVGFFGHRYLTFGPGIIVTIRRLLFEGSK